MNKRTKITSLATAALAGVILASANLSGNVKAAEKDNNAAQVTQVQPAQSTTKNSDSKTTTTDSKQETTKDESQTTTYEEQAKVVQRAKVDVNTKQAIVNSAQKSLATAQKNIEEGKDKDKAAARKELNEQIKTVQAKNKELAPASNKSNEAAKAYVSANNSALKAKSQLSNLNNQKLTWNRVIEHDQNESVVKNAKEKLAEVEKQLPEVQANYEKLQKEADAAKKTYDDARTSYNTLIKEYTEEVNKLNKLRGITNPDQYLDNVKKNLATAQENLEKAQKTLSEEEAKLDTLKPAESEDTTTTTTPVTEDTAATTTTTDSVPSTVDTTKTDAAATEEREDKQEVKSYKLTHNAFVYDKNGKRVKKTWIKRGKTIKALATVTINGKKYYQIGENEFIKVANTKVKTKAVKIRATVKGSKKVATVNRAGKKNDHYVTGGHTYKFNEKATINGKTYYKISGKNNWVVASKLSIKK